MSVPIGRSGEGSSSCKPNCKLNCKLRVLQEKNITDRQKHDPYPANLLAHTGFAYTQLWNNTRTRLSAPTCPTGAASRADARPHPWTTRETTTRARAHEAGQTPAQDHAAYAIAAAHILARPCATAAAAGIDPTADRGHEAAAPTAHAAQRS